MLGYKEREFVMTGRNMLHAVSAGGEQADMRGHDEVGAGATAAGEGLATVISFPDSGREESSPVWSISTGRLVVALGVVFAVSLVVFMVCTGLDQVGIVMDRMVTVTENQSTLADVAREYLPQLPSGDAVMILQQINDLADVHVSAGQRLWIPRMP